MILDEIVASNKHELAARKHDLPLAELQKMASARPEPLDMAAVLKGDDIRLIAEVKKASPSRGVIRADFDPVATAEIYADNGAAAISVLTEQQYFQGSLEYLQNIKKALDNRRLPVLRKDFIYEPYQVYESRAYGADCLLLIVAILNRYKVEELLGLSHRLGMSCLVEVHNEAEVATAVNSQARIIGINNRDLKTFNVDLLTTQRLRPLIPPDRIVVSESGIRNRDDMARLKGWGVNAVLIGEAFMAAPDIAAMMKELR